MTPDRWEEINRLYNSAVEVEEKERASFLEKACGADTELRHEVVIYQRTAERNCGRLTQHLGVLRRTSLSEGAETPLASFCRETLGLPPEVRQTVKRQCTVD